jgi:hypothetical protein
MAARWSSSIAAIGTSLLFELSLTPGRWPTSFSGTTDKNVEYVRREKDWD